MFSVVSGRYFLYREPVSMHKSFDGLSGLASSRLGQDPRSGDVFIFVNRGRNLIKLLRWEPGGFVLFYKRLERGTFEPPGQETSGLGQAIEYGQLVMIVTGFSLRYTKKRERF
jgi:transposase